MERSDMWLVMGFAVCYRKHSWAIGFWRQGWDLDGVVVGFSFFPNLPVSLLTYHGLDELFPTHGFFLFSSLFSGL